MTKTYEELVQFSQKIFEAVGFSAADASAAALALVAADLRGIDSHGVARLSGYVRLCKVGRLNAQAQPKIIAETPSTATLDADMGAGLLAATQAMQIAIQKAKNVGVGFVAVCNSNHFGIAAYHAMQAAQEDMIGIAFTNASPLVAPTGSHEKLLGTNPMCYVFPCRKYPDLVFDMATSAAANGKLQIAERLQKPLPQGWAITKDGAPTTDAGVLKKGGALLPLGSTTDLGSHKGYGLAAVVDLFSGVLSGANFAGWVPPFVPFLGVQPHLPGKGIGHFLGAMRVDAFRSKHSYYEAINLWIERFKSAVPSDPSQPVLVHGEIEHNHEQHRKANGIQLEQAVIDDLMALGAEYNIDFLG